MSTVAEIHKLAGQLLPALQRDSVQGITDHRDAWTFFKQFAAQQGVQFDPGDTFPQLNLWSVANGDFGPVLPVPDSWKMDNLSLIHI